MSRVVMLQVANPDDKSVAARLRRVDAVCTQSGVAPAGHSWIVDPWGDVLIEAGNDEGFAYADFDPSLASKVRAEFPALADRRWTLSTKESA